MKPKLIVALMVLLIGVLHSQAVFFSEDFENGAGDWVFANHATAPNKWYHGTAASNGGNYGIYISNTNGATNAYQYETVNGLGATSRVYAYHNIAVPANHVNITLQFDIRCAGSINHDYMKIYYMPVSVTPVGGNTWFNAVSLENDLYEDYRIGDTHYNQSTSLTDPVGGWHTKIINISSDYAGQTGRLVFMWCNDNSTESAPPGGIDNVSISSIPANQPPFITLIDHPANGANMISLTPILNWQPNIYGPMPSNYEVYLGTTNPPTGEPIYTGAETSYLVSNLLNTETIYYWRVVPSNQYGTAEVSSCPVWSFTTVGENLVAVGSGTTLGASPPFSPYYNFNYSQVIYLASELTSMPAGCTITYMAYHYRTRDGYGYLNLNETINVYMMNTTEDEFDDNTDWFPINQFVQVYSGFITAQGPESYAIIELNMNPFTYTGGNIVVAVSELVNTHDNAHYWTGWDQTDFPRQYRTLRYMSDTTYPNVYNPPVGTRLSVIPNTLFTFSVPPGNNLFMVPTNIIVGNLSQNTAVNVPVTLRSYGAVPITISTFECSAGISTRHATPFTMSPNDTEIVMFTILPTTVTNSYLGSITTTSDASNGPTHTVTLTGAVLPETMVEISDGLNLQVAEVPMYANFRYSYTQMLYLASEINRPSGQTITQLQFHYNSYQNVNNDVDIYLGYTSRNNLNGFLPAETFTHVFYGSFAMSTAIDPFTGGHWINVTLDEPFVYNANQNLVIAFVDNQGGDYASSLNKFYHVVTPSYRSIYHYSDGNSYNISSEYQGALIRSVPNIRMFFGPAIQGSYLSMPIRSLQYNAVNANNPATLPLFISNLGTAPFTISSITLPTYMTSSLQIPYTINVGQTESIDFTFLPLQDGPYSGLVHIFSNASNASVVTVTATANVIPEYYLLVGDGTDIDRNLPFDPSRRFNYSQSIYLPEDLEYMGTNAIITQLGYQYNGYAAFTQSIRVYMGYTSRSTFSNSIESFIPIDEQTLVYDGPIYTVATPGSIAFFTLNTPFVYNGTQNLVISLNEYQDGPNANSNCDFYCTSKATSRSLMVYRDNVAFNENDLAEEMAVMQLRAYIPNTAFSFEPSGQPRPRGLSAVVNLGSISLSWLQPNFPNDPSDFTFVGYKIYRNGFDIASGYMETSLTDTEITGGTTYHYHVTAEYQDGAGVFVESRPSNTVTLVANAARVEVSPPTNLIATDSSGRVSLSWQPGLLVMSESFEGNMPPPWPQTEWDNDGYGWLTSPSGGIDGNGYIYSSSIGADNTLIGVSNFLMTPVIPIATANTWLNYWVGGFDANTASETIWLMIAFPPSDNPLDFELVINETLTDHSWQRRSYDLSAYAGEEIRIAFGHITSPSLNRNRLKLDGVEIVKPNESIQNLPLSYNVYLDYAPTPIAENLAQLDYLLPDLSAGNHTVWVTAVYDAVGAVESTPSNVVVIPNASANADDTLLPQTTKLVSNYPNPFNPTTTISFELAQTSHVCIEVYNIKGQSVAVIADKDFKAGRHSVMWNGVDFTGKPVGSGVYLYRMVAPGYSGVRKMLLMK